MLVLGQLQTLSHRAAVRHVVCAEHGELVEAPELAGTIDNETRMVAVTLGVDSDDEHCAAANGLRPHIASTVTFDIVASVPSAPIAQRVVPSSRPALAGYRIAPKTSPPASPLVA